MTAIPLSSIADMADGLPVLAVRGTVKYAGDVEHGISPKGYEWAKQFFVLSDNGAEVGATLWQADDNEMKKGETVLIENIQNDKKQWLGMVKGSYTNKKNELCHTLEIRANQVKIKPIDRGDAAVKETVSNSTTIGNAAPTSKPESVATNGINKARQHIMQSVNLYNLCVDAVENCIKPHIEGMTAELYQAAIGTVFIESSRAGLVACMPIKPLPDHNGNEKVERPPLEEQSEVPF